MTRGVSFVVDNSVKFTDPLGHDVGCAGEDASYCPPPLIATSENPSNPPYKDAETDTSFLTPPIPTASSCTPEIPCMSEWEIPSMWDTDPTHSDYTVLTLTTGEAVVLEGVFIVDRYGQMYVGIAGGLGGGLPIAATLYTGKVQSNYSINSPASPATLENFLSGTYANGSAGLVGGGGATWTLNGSNMFSIEYGASTPQAGVSVGYIMILPMTQQNIPSY